MHAIPFYISVALILLLFIFSNAVVSGVFCKLPVCVGSTTTLTINHCCGISVTSYVSLCLHLTTTIQASYPLFCEKKSVTRWHEGWLTRYIVLNQMDLMDFTDYKAEHRQTISISKTKCRVGKNALYIVFKGHSSKFGKFNRGPVSLHCISLWQEATQWKKKVYRGALICWKIVVWLLTGLSWLSSSNPEIPKGTQHHPILCLAHRERYVTWHIV